MVDAVLAGRLTLITSRALHEELDRVLRYPKLASVFPEPERILALRTAIAEPVDPTLRLAVLADEPDNRVLEGAAAGQAEAIVTGDAELRELRVFEGIPILTASQLAGLSPRSHNRGMARLILAPGRAGCSERARQIAAGT